MSTKIIVAGISWLVVIGIGVTVYKISWIPWAKNIEEQYSQAEKDKVYESTMGTSRYNPVQLIVPTGGIQAIFLDKKFNEILSNNKIWIQTITSKENITERVAKNPNGVGVTTVSDFIKYGVKDKPEAIIVALIKREKDKDYVIIANRKFAATQKLQNILFQFLSGFFEARVNLGAFDLVGLNENYNLFCSTDSHDYIERIILGHLMKETGARYFGELDTKPEALFNEMFIKHVHKNMRPSITENMSNIPNFEWEKYSGDQGPEVFFRRGSDSLTKASQQRLNRFVNQVREKQLLVKVVAMSPSKINTSKERYFSLRRADAVAVFIVNSGINPDHVHIVEANTEGDLNVAVFSIPFPY